MPDGTPVETPEPEPTPEPPPAAVNAVVAPQPAGGGEGELSQDDPANMGSAIKSDDMYRAITQAAGDPGESCRRASRTCCSRPACSA